MCDYVSNFDVEWQTLEMDISEGDIVTYCVLLVTDDSDVLLSELAVNESIEEEVLSCFWLLESMAYSPPIIYHPGDHSCTLVCYIFTGLRPTLKTQRAS